MIYYCYGFLINNTESCPDLHIAWLSLGNVHKYILVSCHPLYDWTMEPQYLWAYFFMTLPMGPDLLLQIQIFSMILGPYHTRLLLSLFLWSWTMNNFSASKENNYQVHQSTFTILPVFLAMAVWWATHCSRGASSARNCSTYIDCHQWIPWIELVPPTSFSNASQIRLAFHDTWRLQRGLYHDTSMAGICSCSTMERWQSCLSCEEGPWCDISRPGTISRCFLSGDIMWWNSFTSQRGHQC